MSHRKVIESYYADMNNLADLLTKLVNSYRLLIGGAHELNGVALADRGDIKDALERAGELGKIIDYVLDALKGIGHTYVDYCKLKSDLIKCQIDVQYIQNEIDSEIKLKE